MNKEQMIGGTWYTCKAYPAYFWRFLRNEEYKIYYSARKFDVQIYEDVVSFISNESFFKDIYEATNEQLSKFLPREHPDLNINREQTFKFLL